MAYTLEEHISLGIIDDDFVQSIQEVMTITWEEVPDKPKSSHSCLNV